MSTNLYEKLSEERKRLQAEGLVPEWYSTAAFQIFSQKYEYQTNGRSVRGQYERIAKTAARHLKGTKWENVAEQKFFDLLWSGVLSPSTPVLANMGTNRGLIVSCSGGYIQDSIHGFYSSRHETAMLTKTGFGTSGYLGDIRPRGSAISVGGKASGVVPVFKGFVQDMRDVAQGTARRGAWAGYLPIEHGDFDELVDHIMAEPDDANVGWIITSEFIEKLNCGDSEAVRRYQKAMKMKMVLGKGYFCFIDKINAKRPEMYLKNGLEVKGSNLCVTGDTVVDVRIDGKIQTIEMFDLVKLFKTKTIEALSYDGNRFDYKKITAAALTAKSATLVRVTQKASGLSVRCTPDHEFYTQNRGYVAAKDLTNSDLLILGGDYDYETNIAGVEVEFLSEVEDVYDITVEDNHNFFANGVLVHNCNEITLFADEDHTFTCVLSSMVVSRWDDWKDTDAAYWATIFLDCVAAEFIDQAKYIPGLEKAVRFTEKGRALGLGQMGFHTLLQSKMIPFESFQAHMLSQQVAKHIFEESLRASKDMAIELGEPEWCKGFGVRNTHRIAVAPNKSSALYMGGVSEGINPDPAMTFTQLSAAGEIDRVNPALLELMKRKGVYNKKNIAEISEKKGSVQHVDWLTAEEKEVFKTAFEINQKSIIRMASARGQFIDQWQSLNLFFAADEDPAWISEVHQEAFQDPNILGLYYVYSMAGVQGAKGECVACEA